MVIIADRDYFTTKEERKKTYLVTNGWRLNVCIGDIGAVFSRHSTMTHSPASIQNKTHWSM